MISYKLLLVQAIILDFSTCLSFIVAEYSILSMESTGKS